MVESFLHIRFSSEGTEVSATNGSYNFPKANISLKVKITFLQAHHRANYSSLCSQSMGQI